MKRLWSWAAIVAGGLYFLLPLSLAVVHSFVGIRVVNRLVELNGHTDIAGSTLTASIIFVLVYGRMLEIYLLTSLAPIPKATISHREVGQIGQNYLRSLFALGFQGFLIIICVGIYAVLVQSLAFTDDIIADIWGIMGYTVLLCFTLFKTGTLAKSVFNAH